jgi:hypothetical protein
MPSVPQRKLNREITEPVSPLRESFPPPPPAEEIYRRIQETAYFKAQARGFGPGVEMQDWLEAEQEVRGKLKNP